MRQRHVDAGELALDGFWDAVAQRQAPTSPAHTVDPVTEATLRSLHARADGPEPDSAFVQHLLARLMMAPQSIPLASTGYAARSPFAQIPLPLGGQGIVPPPQRRHWPFAAFATVAFVLLALVVGSQVYRSSTPESTRNVLHLPALIAGTPATETCRVSARAKSVPDDGFSGKPAASLVPPNEVTPSSGDGSGPPALTERDLPSGQPASPAIANGVKATVRQLLVCAGQEGDERVLAFYSDDYFRRPSTVSGHGISYWSPPDNLKGSGISIDIRDIRVLPDSRVGAIVEGPSFVPVFFIFVHHDNRWLIDEFVLLFPSADATPSPSGPRAGVSAQCGRMPEDERVSSLRIKGQTIGAAIIGSARGHFLPGHLTMAANTPLQLTLLNCQTESIGFVIDALHIDVYLPPGGTTTINVTAPAGVYDFYSDLPGQRDAGMTGTLILTNQATPAP